jgi:hypothetical protein
MRRREKVRCHCNYGAPCNRNMHFAARGDGYAEVEVIGQDSDAHPLPNPSDLVDYN